MKKILAVTMILSATGSMAFAGKAELLEFTGRTLKGSVQVTEKVSARNLQNNFQTALWKNETFVKAKLVRGKDKNVLAVQDNILNTLLPDGKRIKIHLVSEGEVIQINHQDRLAVISKLIIQTDTNSSNILKNLNDEVFMQRQMKFSDRGNGLKQTTVEVDSRNLDEIHDALLRLASGINNRSLGENVLHTTTLSRKSVK